MTAAEPDELKRLLDAFDAVLDLAEGERDAWVADLALRDAALAERLRELLAARQQARAGGFMHESVQMPALAPHPAADPAAALAQGDLAADQMVGAYRLVRELGAGGMGVVWLAERADGLFKRPVALKLPHLGLQAKVFAERFARERAILAGLDHPHIARLYDAGVTAHGQPFLAIEYVEGESLNVYCDRQRLGVAARLKLFVDVLHAVQYAHNQLVVHRDLKPANILVTREGQVKLLDFGIARLLADAASADETSLTQLGGRALTPDYASPEQIMDGTIGTASDIYSLGVVLYELLVGQRPYKLKRDTRGALEDAIVTLEVQRPSEAVIDDVAALARGSDPPRLRRQLKGDLDTIVLAAMAKQPAARFTTCSAFADDLQRHLDGHAVLARPESTLYRARKFALRHRFGVGAAAAVLMLVLGSATVAIVQGLKARDEAAIANATRQFIVGVFEHNSSSQGNPEKARSTTARQLLDQGRDQLLSGPALDPTVKQALLATLSEMYMQLGLSSEVLLLDRARLALNRSAFGDLDPRTLDAQRDVAGALLQEGTNDEEMAALAKDTVAKLERIGDRDSLLRARSELLLAEVLSQTRDPSAFEHQKRAVALMGRHGADKDYPVALGNYARSQLAQGDAVGARSSATLALQAWGRQPSAQKDIGGFLHGIAGQIHEALDDLRASESTLREGIRLERETYEVNSWQRHLGWLRLSRLLTRTGRAAEVLNESPDVLARLSAVSDTPPWFHARALAIVIGAAVEVGDRATIGSVAHTLQRVGCDHGDPFTAIVCRQALLEAQRSRGELTSTSALLQDLETRTQAMLAQPGLPAGIPIDTLTTIARARFTLGTLPQATQAADAARQKLSALPVQPVILDLRLGLVERDLLRATGDSAAARALTERLRTRIAAHADRALLEVYERVLAS